MIDGHLTITNSKSGVYPGEAYILKNLGISPKEEVKTVEFKGNITEIDSAVFRDFKNLENIIIPNTVKKIGNSAFEGCENLKSIIIPNSVSEIQERAFYGCVNLISVEILSPEACIGEGAFNYCNSLMRIILPQKILLTRHIHKLMPKEALVHVTREEAINRIFVNCNSLMKKFLI